MAVFVGSALPGATAVAGPALLFEPATGQVLFADDPDQPWFPASLTKMMTAYVTFEAVKAGEIAFDGKLALSQNARAQPATRIGLRGGIELTFEQAVRGLILRSANDFAMALAEGISGSEEAFAARMNTTARRLGMTKSQFRNPHGLPHDEQFTTARDMAILTQALLRDFPERAEVFSTPEVKIHKGTFHSQNDLLRTLPGGDGMKTGFTCGAGYNVVASATREGRRLVAVVFGEQTRVKRSERATALIEHGFTTYDWRQLTGKAVRLAELQPSPAETKDAPILAGTVRMRKCAYGAAALRRDHAPVAAAPVGDQPAGGATPAAAAAAEEE